MIKNVVASAVHNFMFLFPDCCWTHLIKRGCFNLICKSGKFQAGFDVILVQGRMIYGQTVYGQTLEGQTVEGHKVYRTKGI